MEALFANPWTPPINMTSSYPSPPYQQTPTSLYPQSFTTDPRFQSSCYTNQSDMSLPTFADADNVWRQPMETYPSPCVESSFPDSEASQSIVSSDDDDENHLSPPVSYAPQYNQSALPTTPSPVIMPPNLIDDLFPVDYAVSHDPSFSSSSSSSSSLPSSSSSYSFFQLMSEPLLTENYTLADCSRFHQHNYTHTILSEAPPLTPAMIFRIRSATVSAAAAAMAYERENQRARMSVFGLELDQPLPRVQFHKVYTPSLPPINTHKKERAFRACAHCHTSKRACSQWPCFRCTNLGKTCIPQARASDGVNAEKLKKKKKMMKKNKADKGGGVSRL